MKKSKSFKFFSNYHFYKNIVTFIFLEINELSNEIYKILKQKKLNIILNINKKKIYFDHF